MQRPVVLMNTKSKRVRGRGGSPAFEDVGGEREEGAEALRRPAAEEGAEALRRPAAEEGAEALHRPAAEEGVEALHWPAVEEGVKALRQPGTVENAVMEVTAIWISRHQDLHGKEDGCASRPSRAGRRRAAASPNALGRASLVSGGA
jgi:hypothetical protein